MAIYRDGKLVGAGGSIAATIFTDGVTLEGDGSKNNRVRVKNAGINTVHLGENAVTLAKVAQSEANRVLVYDSTGALVEGRRYAPKRFGGTSNKGVVLNHSGRFQQIMPIPQF